MGHRKQTISKSLSNRNPQKGLYTFSFVYLWGLPFGFQFSVFSFQFLVQFSVFWRSAGMLWKTCFSPPLFCLSFLEFLAWRCPQLAVCLTEYSPCPVATTMPLPSTQRSSLCLFSHWSKFFAWGTLCCCRVWCPFFRTVNFLILYPALIIVCVSWVNVFISPAGKLALLFWNTYKCIFKSSESCEIASICSENIICFKTSWLKCLTAPN